VSAFSLAAVLSAQHGVALQPPDEPEPSRSSPRCLAPGARSAGCLVDKGLITQTQLAEALLTQADTDGRLGEILVDGGAITGSQLRTRSANSTASS
jgi:hypothetical protein